MIINRCTNCGHDQWESYDEDDGEFLPEWLVDARDIPGWEQAKEQALLRWQNSNNYSDEEIGWAIEGLVNSERLSGKRPAGYASLSMALQRRVRMGWDRPQTRNGSQPYVQRYPAKGGRY